MSTTKNRDLLFVYGTLQVEANTPMARFLQQHSHKLGKASMPGRLYDAASFPAAIYKKDALTKVHGSLHTLSDLSALFHQLDYYEGYDPHNPGGSLFVRKKITAIYNNNRLSAFAYLFNRSTAELNPINSGDYLACCTHNH